MGNVVVLEVENALGVLDDGRRVGGDEELDGLGHAVVAEEGATLAPLELASGSSDGDEESVGRDLGDDFGVGGAKLDVDKVDLELLLRLDSDEDGGTAAGDDDLVGVVDRLEDKGKGSLL